MWIMIRQNPFCKFLSFKNQFLNHFFRATSHNRGSLPIVVVKNLRPKGNLHFECFPLGDFDFSDNGGFEDNTTQISPLNRCAR